MAIKIVIGIIIVLIIGIIIFVIYKEKTKDNIMDGGNMTKYSDELLRLVMKDRTYDKLKKITYSSSGDSNGNIYHVTLIIDEKKVIEERKDVHSDPLHIKEFSVTDADIELLLNDIEEYNFPEWKDLKVNYDEIALDAPSRGITFVYDNSESKRSKEEYYHIDFNMDIPEDGREALNEFNNYLNGLLKEKNKINEYDQKEEEEPQMIQTFNPSSINPEQ